MWLIPAKQYNFDSGRLFVSLNLQKHSVSLSTHLGCVSGVNAAPLFVCLFCLFVCFPSLSVFIYTFWFALVFTLSFSNMQTFWVLFVLRSPQDNPWDYDPDAQVWGCRDSRGRSFNCHRSGTGKLPHLAIKECFFQIQAASEPSICFFVCFCFLLTS